MCPYEFGVVLYDVTGKMRLFASQWLATPGVDRRTATHCEGISDSFESRYRVNESDIV